jgi:hypothetical protein
MPTAAPIDLIEELRLRRWAREHDVPPGAREGLHPVIVDELRRKESERLQTAATNLSVGPQPVATEESRPVLLPRGTAIVPLLPEDPRRHGPHEIAPAHVLLAAIRGPLPGWSAESARLARPMLVAGLSGQQCTAPQSLSAGQPGEMYYT